MPIYKVVPLICIAALAACDAGSSDKNPTVPTPTVPTPTVPTPATPTPPVTPSAQFAQLKANEIAFAEQILAAGPTATDDVPTAGSAEYTGILGLALQNGSEDAVIGTAEINADFASNTITGSASDFYDIDSNPTAGSVTIENGQYGRIINIFSADVNGDVTFKSGQRDILTQVAGNFSGDNAEFISGVMSGAATDENNDVAAVQGVFYGEK